MFFHCIICLYGLFLWYFLPWVIIMLCFTMTPNCWVPSGPGVFCCVGEMLCYSVSQITLVIKRYLFSIYNPTPSWILDNVRTILSFVEVLLLVRVSFVNALLLLRLWREVMNTFILWGFENILRKVCATIGMLGVYHTCLK